MGYVADLFDEARLARLPGRSAVGHVRYSTAGGSLLENAQPIVYNTNKGPLAIAHNGNLVNADELRRRAGAGGVDLHDDLRHRGPPAPDGPLEGGEPRRGAPRHARRASGAPTRSSSSPGRRSSRRATRRASGRSTIGRLGDAWLVASETCAFDLLDAEPLRDVEPGEIVILDAGGVASVLVRDGAADGLLRLRARLLRPPRLDRLPPVGRRVAPRVRAAPGARAPRRGRRRRPRPRLGDLRGARLRRGERHPVRHGARAGTTTSAGPSSSRSSRSATSASR